MTQSYIEYHFTVSPLQPASEILVAQLGALEFESFIETETGKIQRLQTLTLVS